MSTNTETRRDGAPGVAGVRSWLPPQPGPITRGTVVLLPGRGEHAGVYERFGRRLASDAYAVHALDLAPDEDPADLRDRIAELTASAAGPVVLAGSDTGALHALALAADGKADVDAVLLAGIPGPAAAIGEDDADWEGELALRTSCPTHRGKLAQDDTFVRGSLFDPVPDRLAAYLELDASGYEEVGSTLIIHGAADVLSSSDTARSLAARLPHAELVLVTGAPHDVLNDATHRSVAAVVVQWLERLRAGAPYTAIIEHG